MPLLHHWYDYAGREHEHDDYVDEYHDHDYAEQGHSHYCTGGYCY